MPFKFAARTLLELGKELISSDEVALYELIKNGVDAGSPRIGINAEVVIPHSAYLEALESLDNGFQTRSVLDSLCEKLIPGVSSERASLFVDPLRRQLVILAAFVRC
jgi:hypothetical protein